MEKNIHKYDQYLKDGFENFEVNAPDSVWQGIENGIQQTPQIPSDPGISTSISNGLLKTLAGLKLKAVLLVVGATIGVGTLVYNVVESNEKGSPNKNEISLDSSNSTLQDKESKPLEGETKPDVINSSNDDLADLPNKAETGNDLGNKKDTPKKDNSPKLPLEDNIGKTPESPKEENPKNESNLNLPASAEDYKPELICPNAVVCKGKDLFVQVKSNRPWILKSNNQELTRGTKDGDYKISYDKLAGSNKIFLCNEEGKVLAYKTIKLDHLDARLEIIELEPGRFRFNSNINHYAKLEWDFGDGIKSTEIEPIHQYSYSNKGIKNIKFSAWSFNNCQIELSQALNLTNLPDFKEPIIPNVITPDLADNLNDDFNILIENEEFYHLIITDLNGQIVFESFDKNKRFNGVNMYNGTACPAGKYQYIFRYKLKGYANDYKNGVFTIIRNR